LSFEWCIYYTAQPYMPVWSKQNLSIDWSS
jgi:hypothetical protein